MLTSSNIDRCNEMITVIKIILITTVVITIMLMKITMIPITIIKSIIVMMLKKTSSPSLSFTL